MIVLRKLFPGVQIIFGTIMPVGASDSTGIQHYNSIMKKVAERHGVLVDDLFALMHDKMVTYDRGDGLHLNEEGNTIAARQVVSAIERYL